MTNKTIDMSPQAVTNRMVALDELWELAVALKSSEIVEEPEVEGRGEILTKDQPRVREG